MTTTARILIADDDERLREATRAVLEEAGHFVVEASDGAEALRMQRTAQVDVILCDMFMPGQDGIETIRVLRRDFPILKIIAVSGGGYSGAIDVLRMARLIGAMEVLSKPYSRVALLDAIERVMRAPPTSLRA
jgi:two-component system, chemotaxis family, chemotaxis protein CheY